MPDIDSAGYGVNPSVEPWTYPGRKVDGNALLVDDWLYPVELDGDWLVTLDGGPLDRARVPLTLDRALTAFGLPVMADRRPILAVGSNASPGQLRHKFSKAECDGVVPMTRARCGGGLAVAFSAHVSVPGYVPYAPYVRESTRACSLTVLWLTERQVAVMDATERHYDSIRLPSRYSIVLDSAHAIEHCSIYRGRWGVIASEPGGDPYPPGTQADIMSHLAGWSWFAPVWNGTPEQTVTDFARDPEQRETARELLHAHGMAVDDGMGPR